MNLCFKLSITQALLALFLNYRNTKYTVGSILKAWYHSLSVYSGLHIKAGMKESSSCRTCKINVFVKVSNSAVWDGKKGL